jgi:uncharacterized protein (TIGR02118 family)
MPRTDDAASVRRIEVGLKTGGNADGGTMTGAMTGAVSLIRRRDDIDAGRFSRHWLDVHGPLVCRLPGLRSYAQGHVVAALTDAARDMAIDGFAELAFDSVAARAAAYGSAELAACDRDSPGFIGSVSRLITDAEVVVPRPDASSLTKPPGLTKLVILFPPGVAADRGALEQSVRRQPLGGLIWHHVREQGRAANSAVPELLCPVAVLAELWVGRPVTAEAIGVAQAGVSSFAFSVAVFSVREHRLL